MQPSTRARHRFTTALALVFAVECVSAVSVAAASVPAGLAGVNAPTARTLVAERSVLDDSRPPAAPSSVPAFAVRIVEPAGWPAPVAEAIAPPAAPQPARETVPQRQPRAQAEVKSTKPAAPSKPAKTSKPATQAANRPVRNAASYSGYNHVWIPSLGINKSVRSFACSRTREPDNYVYRWGCAGTNNVYIMGHAWGVMKPLHDAYVSGRLKVGMRAFYAGSNGKVHEYKVKWWKLTRPTPDAAWAWAAQSVPSMTLQTCVGRNSEFRLMVRLVEVG
jgi:hypothetical protein